MSQSTDHHQLIHNLGRAGLIPFILLALMAWLLKGDELIFASSALASYAALIVSFLGGIHWGAAWVHSQAGSSHRDDHQVPALWWGICASVLAWPGALMPADAGLIWLGLLLIVCYLFDRKLYHSAGLQQWLKLRFQLSTVAALCCFLAAGAL
ncbi:MAG: hypothetical protein RLZZ555_523 [Pseudomonadota bacterium]|jgi:Protein of unknown function (DUF3429)